VNNLPDGNTRSYAKRCEDIRQDQEQLLDKEEEIIMDVNFSCSWR